MTEKNKAIFKEFFRLKMDITNKENEKIILLDEFMKITKAHIAHPTDGDFGTGQYIDWLEDKIITYLSNINIKSIKKLEKKANKV